MNGGDGGDGGGRVFFPFIPKKAGDWEFFRWEPEWGGRGGVGGGGGGGGEPLGMLCPDLVHITAVINRKMKGSHILDTTAARTRCEWA